jgi:hypothetical protein
MPNPKRPFPIMLLIVLMSAIYLGGCTTVNGRPVNDVVQEHKALVELSSTVIATTALNVVKEADRVEVATVMLSVATAVQDLVKADADLTRVESLIDARLQAWNSPYKNTVAVAVKSALNYVEGILRDNYADATPDARLAALRILADAASRGVITAAQAQLGGEITPSTP